MCFFKSLSDENSDPMTTTATSFTCLKTMNTVLLSCTDAPWVYPQLEAFLAKFVNVLLAEGFVDYLEVGRATVAAARRVVLSELQRISSFRCRYRRSFLTHECTMYEEGI